MGERISSLAVSLVTFQLPVPPSSNRFWRMVVIGGKHKPARAQMVLSREARAYKETVARQLLAELQGRHLPLFPSGPVRVTMRWHRTKRLGDLDKRENILLDALQGIVYRNDAQLVELHAFLHEAAVSDYVHVTVSADAVQESVL